MTENVVVAGVGMIPFTQPGKSLPYDEMGADTFARWRPGASYEAADCFKVSKLQTEFGP